MSLNAWITFSLAYLITTISPGPNVLLVIHNSLKYGSPSALVTISGNLLSQLIVVVLVACGVGTTIAALPEFFLVAKIVGAAYLIFLGFRQIFSTRNMKTAPMLVENKVQTITSKIGIFRQAFFVSSSNPKTLIFLSAFMPQFVDPHRPLIVQFSVMYVTIASTVVLVHLFYSASATQLKQTVRNIRTLKLIKYLGGSIFVLLGAKLLSAK